MQSARMQVYFIDNEDYFHRKRVLTDKDGSEFPDNDEKAIFFARGVLETVIKLRWAPDLIHCHGWLTALVPLYIKKYYLDDPLFAHSKVVYSIYNDTFKTPLDARFPEKVLLDGIKPKDVEMIQEPSFVNVSKLAVKYADAIIQGSEKINSEVLDFVKSDGGLFLEYQPEDTYVDTYNSFYDKVF